MKTRAITIVWLALLAGIACGEDPKPEEAKRTGVPADRRELWVPANQLSTILKKHPKAVLLSREQYETLLRDASTEEEEKVRAPREALLSAAAYEARADGGVLVVTATLRAQSNSDEWTTLGLPFTEATLGAITLDGGTAVQPPVRGKESRPAVLLMHGRGNHAIGVEFTVPIQRKGGRSDVAFMVPPAAAANLSLKLPPDVRVESDTLPLKISPGPNGITATASIGAAIPRITLNWRSTGAAAEASVIEQQTSVSFAIDAGRLRTEAGLHLIATLGDLPGEVRLPIPGEAQVLRVEGAGVSHWSLDGTELVVTFQAGDRAAADFSITLEQASLGDAADAVLKLPLPMVESARVVRGDFSISADAGVAVRKIVIDSATRQMGAASPERSDLIGKYEFAGRVAAPQVAIERVARQVDADIDTLVEFKREAIFIERTVHFHVRSGELFTSIVTLPAGEELVSVHHAKGAEVGWRREGEAIRVDEPQTFTIRTRVEPKGWADLDAAGIDFSLGNLSIAGVGKVTGYLALQADPGFRLEAAPSETLERRDGRVTPVRGSHAWFRRGPFSLTVKVTKRPVEVRAAITGHALPLEGVLDLHAQVAYEFLDSGTRSVRIRVPGALASNFHFEGPHIAERNFADDVWTIVFQTEQTGAYHLRIEAQVPISRDADDATRFHIDVPVITPLEVSRSSGLWAVEANTETEIAFTTRGMNELDALAAPTLPDYLPRHRVIGVFGWMGSDYRLSLAGVRHPSAETVNTVIDQLELDTVVSTSGAERNQATLLVRTAGSQFLDVALPQGSNLLSLAVDGAVAKPVTGRPGELRIQLPAKAMSAEPVTILLIYETATPAWEGRGNYAISAPHVAEAIPVLRSRWRLFVPEGFEVTGLESDLTAPFQPAPPLLVGAPWRLAQRIADSFELPHEAVASDPETASVNAPVPMAEAPLPPNAPGLESKPSAAPENLLSEASGFYDTGRFDLAAKRVDQVLALDPYNIAARRLQEKINLARDNHANLAYNESSSRMVWQVDAAWANPVRRFGASDAEGPNVDWLRKKMERIIIPKLELKDTTIREAIEFLKKAARENDPDPNPAFRGVNIMLKLDASQMGLAPTPPPPAPQIPGLEPLPGVSLAPETAREVPTESTITVSLSNIPLIEALRYVTSLAGLKFNVTPTGVQIVPQNVDTTLMVTREFNVRPGFVVNAPVQGVDADATKGGSAMAGRLDAKDFLASVGVSFPGDASATYLPGNSRLIVRNTPENLDFMDNLIHADSAGPASLDLQRPAPIRTAGLLPIQLDLPRVGQQFVLEGFYGAKEVEFRYEDWWSRARRLWIWFVVGGFIFLPLGRQRPWWRTAWAILILTFVPLCLGSNWTPICNALLGGWLTGFLIHRLAAWFVFAPRREEVLA